MARARNKRQSEAAKVRAEAKDRIAQKRETKKYYCTRGVETAEGLVVEFGFRDKNGFHRMEPADYVAEIKKMTGKPPVHKALTLATGIPKKDMDYIKQELGIVTKIEKGLDAEVQAAGDVVKNGVSQTRKIGKRK